MSMNLHLQVDGYKIDLWQTPTRITNMCLVDENFRVASEVKGKKAKRAIAIYLTWVRGTLDGAWESEEELDTQQEIVFEHIDKIKTTVLEGKKICAFRM